MKPKIKWNKNTGAAVKKIDSRMIVITSKDLVAAIRHYITTVLVTTGKQSKGQH